MGVNDLLQAKNEALAAIRVTERALKKHIGLIKKRERISTIVATIEQLRGDIRSEDAKVIRERVQKLNVLTQGFVERVALGKKTNLRKNQG